MSSKCRNTLLRNLSQNSSHNSFADLSFNLFLLSFSQVPNPIGCRPLYRFIWAFAWMEFIIGFVPFLLRRVENSSYCSRSLSTRLFFIISLVYLIDRHSKKQPGESAADTMIWDLPRGSGSSSLGRDHFNVVSFNSFSRVPTASSSSRLSLSHSHRLLSTEREATPSWFFHWRGKLPWNQRSVAGSVVRSFRRKM